MRILTSFLENSENAVERSQPLPPKVPATQGAIPFTAFRADTNRLMTPTSSGDYGRLDDTNSVGYLWNP